MKILALLVVIEISISIVSGQLNYQRKYADAYLTTPELVKKYGYPAEIHSVTTEDGYILELHRIPHGKQKPDGNSKRIPVLLQHGMFHSSADWVFTGPKNGLGYILADSGYDVWLGNSRGNLYSTNHVQLNTTGNKFWDFSFHEMGMYDLPATINYILQVTKQKRLFYVSHSLGSSIFLVMASTRPSYNKKVRAVFGMAPSSYMSNSQASILIPLATTVARFQDSLPIGNQIFPQRDIVRNAGVFLCRDGSVTRHACDYALSLVGGFNYMDPINYSLPLSFGHMPAGASRKGFAHLGQLMTSGRFCEYDYGIWRNFLAYGRRKPPDYNLSKVTSPTFLLYGDNDLLVRKKDVERLYKNLVKVKKKILKTVYTYSHFDFIMAANVKSYVYDYILQEMQDL